MRTRHRPDRRSRRRNHIRRRGRVSAAGTRWGKKKTSMPHSVPWKSAGLRVRISSRTTRSWENSRSRRCRGRAPAELVVVPRRQTLTQGSSGRRTGVGGSRDPWPARRKGFSQPSGSPRLAVRSGLVARGGRARTATGRRCRTAGAVPHTGAVESQPFTSSMTPRGLVPPPGIGLVEQPDGQNSQAFPHGPKRLRNSAAGVSSTSMASRLPEPAISPIIPAAMMRAVPMGRLGRIECGVRG